MTKEEQKATMEDAKMFSLIPEDEPSEVLKMLRWYLVVLVVGVTAFLVTFGLLG